MSAREELLAEKAAGEEQTPALLPRRHPDEIAAELAEVEKALTEYIHREISKVDGIHGFLRYADQTAKVAREEAAAMTERARRLEASRDRLKSLCVSIMAQSDKKRLEGTGGRVLLRKGNGGWAPLVVDGWDGKREEWVSSEGVACSPLPRDLVDITVTLPANEWVQLVSHLPASFITWKRAFAPNGKAIREALAQPCPKCHGKSLEMCAECNGTGNALVPGARLAPRGEHLEVK